MGSSPSLPALLDKKLKMSHTHLIPTVVPATQVFSEFAGICGYPSIAMSINKIF